MSIKERIRQLEDKVDRIERVISKKAFSSWTPEMDRPFSETPIKEYINSDPEIIGNVMRWNGKDYLDADFVPDGSYKGTLTIADLQNNTGKSWVPFDRVDITDVLARMRTDEQPIWVMVNALILGEGFASDSPCKLFAVETNADPIQFICNSVLKNTIAAYKCRLANIDDLKKAGIR